MAKGMVSIGFGIVALILLIFKLPGIENSIGMLSCTVCTAKTPFIALLGAAYFSAFITTILCFPKLPKSLLKNCGIIWTVLLAIFLFYLKPRWCFICLAAHLCHLTMWIFWTPRQKVTNTSVGIRIALVFIVAISMTVFFSALNFIFLTYVHPPTFQ